jgi:hypothetical protein
MVEPVPSVTAERPFGHALAVDAKSAPVLLSTHAFTTFPDKLTAAVATPPARTAPPIKPIATFEIVFKSFNLRIA